MRKQRAERAKAKRVKGGRLALVGGLLLILVMLLGIANGLMVTWEGSQVESPDEILSEKTGNLYGQVTDIDGVPLEQAKVSVVGTTYETFTNPEGWYFMEGLPVKVYQVQVEKANYTSIIRKVKVEENMPRPVNFQMEQGEGAKGETGNIPLVLDHLKPSYAYSVVIILLASIMAGIGGILAVRKKSFRFVVVCAAIGILTYGFVAGMMMSLVALVMLVMARPAFVATAAKVPAREAAPVAARPRRRKRKVVEDTSFEEFDEPVEEAEASKVLESRKAELELDAEGGEALPPPEEEAIPEAEIREDLVSKAQEAEGTVEDSEADLESTPVRPKRKKRQEVGPEVVKDMEDALKETLDEPDDTETDIVSSVLDKLGIDASAAEKPVEVPKKKKKKKRKIKAHQETELCRVCVKPIIIASDAIRCKCGRRYHQHCAREVKVCKKCGRDL
jgi:hypothetical protein